MGRIRTILLFLLTVHVCNKTLATADSTLQLTLQKQIPGSYSGFSVDGFGNIYLTGQDGQVKKLGSNYDSVAVFNNVRQYGNVFTLDASNPLKEVVFYKDFSTILVLDRFLNTRNTINLRNAGILQVSAAAASYDNNYWVFDELDNKIKKVDDYGNVLLESADFRVLFAEGFSPSAIIDNDGLLYLYDINAGWLVFDYYGAFKQKIPLSDWLDVQVENKNLLGHDAYWLYTTGTAATNIKQAKPNINLAQVIKLQKKGNNFFVLTKEGLSIYTL